MCNSCGDCKDLEHEFEGCYVEFDVVFISHSHNSIFANNCVEGILLRGRSPRTFILSPKPVAHWHVLDDVYLILSSIISMCQNYPPYVRHVTVTCTPLFDPVTALHLLFAKPCPSIQCFTIECFLFKGPSL